MDTLISFHQRFVTEDACLNYLEEMRWANEPACPHCLSCDTYISRTRRMYKCARCRRQFTARTGTIFQDSRLPLQKWFLAVYLLPMYKSGASSLQLADRLDITQKSAWRMLMSIRTMIEPGGATDRKRKAPIRTDLQFDQIMLRIVRAADGR